MQKKLIALAVAGLASSAAFAQSNVTISGTLRPSYDFVSIKDGAGNKTNSITNMNSNTSVIGFAGEEALGNGLKAIFGLTYNLDFTTENTGIGTDGGQDQFVGLASSNWGSVKFGALNNAVKNLFASYDPFSFSIGDYNNIFTQGVNSRNSKAAYYQSPNWNGFTLHGSYALETQKDSKLAAGKEDQSMYSFGADYKLGGLQLSAGYSQGNNETGGTTGADFKSQRYGAAYTFATKTKLFGVVGIDKDFKNVDTGTGSYKTYMIGATHPITSNIDLMGTYIKAGDDSQNETGAKNYNLGVKYALSKRTNVQGLYSYLKNDANSNRGFDSGYDIAAGGKGSAFSVRLQHNF